MAAKESAAAERLAELVARKSWTQADAREVLGALEASGRRLTEFAREHGLVAERLYVWRRRFERERAGKAAAFVPVRVVEPERPARAGRLEVVLPGGLRVRVGADFDEQQLRRVVAALRAETPRC
jgi:transposase